MSRLTVYGASDDLIEIDGDWVAEFYRNEDGPNLLAFDDGTVVRITYTEEGTWEVRALFTGPDTTVKVTFNQGPDSDQYSDRLELVGPMTRAVCGTEMAKADNTPAE